MELKKVLNPHVGKEIDRLLVYFMPLWETWWPNG